MSNQDGSGHPSQDLIALVEVLDGVEVLAAYLDLPPDTLEVALAALPGDPKTERVARMVAENTWKLAGMPSQGGRIWRITRKRVVKDWLILAQRSTALGGKPGLSETETDAPEPSNEQTHALAEIEPEGASGEGEEKPVAGERTTLGPTVYERGENAYWEAALAVLEDQSAPAPQMMKDIAYEIAVKLTDPRIFETYGGSLAEGTGIAYHLAVAETWDDTDPLYARSLIDSGMRTLREEHLASHQPAPADPSDPSSRVYVSALSLCAQHPAYSELRDYFLSRGASERLATIDDLCLGLNYAAASPKRRHRQAFEHANNLSYLVGRSLGMLAVVGELPKTEKPVIEKSEGSGETGMSPLDIVRGRYARGEISRDQYQQLMADLDSA